MLRGVLATLAKDLRLLGRDRVGLVFLGLAPIVVMSVAGLSLAGLYGGAPPGSIHVLPLVDEDGGWVGRALRERLADDPSIRLPAVATRDAARAMVRGRGAAAALVVPSSRHPCSPTVRRPGPAPAHPHVPRAAPPVIARPPHIS